MSRRISALFGALAIALAILPPTAALATSMDAPSGLQPQAATATPIIENRFKGETAGYWIVTLNDSAVASYEGGVSSLAATSAQVTGADRLDTATDAAQAYASYLDANQSDLVARMQARFGRQMDVRYRYANAMNGLSVYLTPDEANVVLKMGGVANVERVRINHLTTDAGPTWIGSPAVWDGSATGVATQGEGVIIGIIDSGINPSNPSFAATGDDGYTVENPLGAGTYLGACDESNTDQYFPGFTCNSKLIGAFDFLTGDDVIDGGVNPLDHDGHGSHTASTAGGNVVDTVGPTGDTLRVSGVAPHANLISYRVCGDTAVGLGGCPSDATVAAVNQAIADGVDVLNFSIGSASPGDPWADADDQAFLNARAAGILVAHSAGNEGPGAATVGSPAAPWVMHVAALTHNRTFLNGLINMTGGDTTPPPNLSGRGATAGYGPERIVYAGDLPADILAKEGVANNALCGTGDPNDDVETRPWPEGTFSGEIVVCDRGTFARVEKSNNAAFAGAGGFVMADNGAGVAADQHTIPGTHISQPDGVILKAWLATGEGHTGTITPGVFTLDDSLGDVMAGFSSRGPNRSTGGDSLMPTLGAPGVDIWAADGKYDQVTYGFKSGTSMASPHAAGAAALLIALRPDWTPAMVQSALATTALFDGPLKEDGTTPVTPFDVGSGRIRVDVAANAGLVFDEIQSNYEDADPASGGDPSQLNLASIAKGQCVQVCEFTRTVTSSAVDTVTWTASSSGAVAVTVEPASFTLASGASQDLLVTVDVSDGAVPANAYSFGQITLEPSDGAVPTAHLPIAVQKRTGDLPAGARMETKRDAGSWVISGLTAIEITDFTASVNGLAKATLTDMSLSVDATNGNPYDNQNDGTVQTEIVSVPAGAKTLIAEILASASPDLDLYVGFDANGDGLGSADEEIALSASGTALEFVSIEDPEPGNWWILVQNWAASSAPPDALTLATAIVDGASVGNAWVEGPATQPQLEPFDVRFYFDIAGSMPGDIYYGDVSLGTDAAHPGNIGGFPVTLRRLGDDIAKTASTNTATWGDTVDYTVTVDSNVNPEDFGYQLEDAIPAGMTFVPGSLSATAGTAWEDGGVVYWEGTQISPFGVEGTYNVSTNADDAACALPLANTASGYLDLAGYGITPQSTIEGDTVAFKAFATSAAPFEFYDDPSAGVSFTDDGFAFFVSEPGSTPWAPQSIPNPAAPNDMAAIHWTDMEIVYDAGTGSGVSLATLGGGIAAVIEYDDMRPWNASDEGFNSDARLDFEMFMWSEIDNSPGAWEIAFAYDNVTGDWSTDYFGDAILGVVGLENETGTAGVEVFAGPVAGAIPDGLIICFDYEGPNLDPIEITYSVTVDDFASGDVTNEVVASVDNPGSAPTTTTSTVAVSGDSIPAMAKITAVQDALLALGETGNKKADKAIEKALKDLGKALDPELWTGAMTLDMKHGKKVFNELKSAVKEIEKIGKELGIDVKPWANALADAARSLAAQAISDAEAASAKAKDVEKAKEKLADGDEKRIGGLKKMDDAIAKYREAWEKATKALEKAVK